MWLRTFFLVCESDLVALPVTAIRGPTCSLPYRYVVSPAVFLTVAVRVPFSLVRPRNGQEYSR